MPPYPAQHCVPHTTFSAPPLEHGLSAPGLYEYHAQHSPDHPVFTYADRDTGESHDIPFSEAWDRIGAVADIVSKQLSKPQLHDESSGRMRPVVGILALSGTSTLPITRCFPSADEVGPRRPQLHIPNSRADEPWLHRLPARPG